MRNTLIKFLLTTALLNISFTTNNLHAQGIIENIKFDQITNENGRSLGFITGIESRTAQVFCGCYTQRTNPITMATLIHTSSKVSIRNIHSLSITLHLSTTTVTKCCG